MGLILAPRTSVPSSGMRSDGDAVDPIATTTINSIARPGFSAATAIRSTKPRADIRCVSICGYGEPGGGVVVMPQQPQSYRSCPRDQPEPFALGRDCLLGRDWLHCTRAVVLLLEETIPPLPPVHSSSAYSTALFKYCISDATTAFTPSTRTSAAAATTRRIPSRAASNLSGYLYRPVLAPDGHARRQNSAR